MNWKELIKIYFSDSYSLNIELGAILLIIIIIFIIVFIFRFVPKKRWKFRNDVELNISLGGIGMVKLKPKYELEQIAHKAWTELITRKAGLLFEPDNDVIVEIYNSWYVLFGEMRKLIKEIPASQIKNENTQKLVNLLVESLNKGLRPHLTKWQAKFRKWYEKESRLNEDKTPQEIQKMYPQYNELIYDLIAINNQMVSYANEIKKIIN